MANRLSDIRFTPSLNGNRKIAGLVPGISLILLVSVIPITTRAQDHGWKGIKILKSSRFDVEKLLGFPEKYNNATYAASYSTNEGRVHVAYSEGTCGVEPNSGWNVPDLTVTSITVYVKPFIPLTKFRSEFKIDEKKFERRPDPEITHDVEYVNETDGISYTVDTDEGTVGAITFFPRAKDEEKLRCSK